MIALAEIKQFAAEIGVDWLLLPKQEEFIDAREKEVLYSGAFAAAKSRAICFKIVERASVKGAREGLCRKHLVTLKATTLRTLLDPAGHLPPVLPPDTYTHNKGEKIIKLNGGGEIVYFGLDDPSKIGSYELSGVGCDEAVELTEADWIMLLGRLRLDVGIPMQIYGACNPGVPSHFLAERFGLALDYKPRKGCRAIQTRSTDNVFLPADYIESLMQFTGVAKKRFVDGLWVGSEGLVYDRWDRTIFVQVREGPWARCWVGMDVGYTNPCCMLLICEDEDGRLHIAREWYETKKTEPEVIKEAERWQRDHDPETWVIDPSAAMLIAGMRAKGLHVTEAENDVYGGIQAVQARLSVAGDGRPRMTVDPRCENTIREKESYEWMKQGRNSEQLQDKPKKQNDHAMDAERYGVVYVDGLAVPVRLDVRDADDEIVRPEAEESRMSRMMDNEAMWT